MENLKKFLNENQNPNAVKKTHKRISELLTSSEMIEYIAIQKKPLFNLSPDSVALTNKRIIFCRPKTFGLSMDFQDFLWKDVADCHMSEGILGATFSMKTIRKQLVSVDYLPKAQARLLYRSAQQKEEEMSEYRRQRELEHTKAAAGGGIVVNAAHKNDSDKPFSKEDPMDSLKKLKVLLEDKLINQEEFDSKKAEIIAKL